MQIHFPTKRRAATALALIALAASLSTALGGIGGLGSAKAASNAPAFSSVRHPADAGGPPATGSLDPATSTACFKKSATAVVEHSYYNPSADAKATMTAQICVANGKVASYSKSSTHATPGSNVKWNSGYTTANESSNKLVVDFASSDTFQLVRNNAPDCKETITTHIVGTVQPSGSVSWKSSTKDQVFLNAAGFCYHYA